MYKSIKTVTKVPKQTDAIICLIHAGMKLHLDDHDLDIEYNNALSTAIDRDECKGDCDETTVVYSESGQRFIILGLGGEENVTPAKIRSAAGALLSTLNRVNAKKIVLRPNSGIVDHMFGSIFGRAFGEGFGLANWSFEQFKSDLTKKKNTKTSAKTTLTISSTESSITKAIKHGLDLAESANLARTLAATPPNIATTTYIADAAKKLAAQFKGTLTCSVIKGDALERNGLEGLINVGKASENPPCLIKLTYTPKRKTKNHILLVGKTVCYDTGGLSLKISNGMKGMKYDKNGGMAVLGAMHSVGWLKPKCKVTALLPAAENSISDEAYRPDDIITFLNGVTVEVTNTDAEGRLVLADALAYGCKKLKPTAIIDVATLTGGVVVALGKPCAGIWCDDDPLRNKLESAGKQAGERVWRLPLFDEYKDMMKSKHADIWNSAPVREAHPIQGAAFLSYFVDENIPWAHIDIAGTSATDKPIGPMCPGPTGFGVRLLANYLEMFK